MKTSRDEDSSSSDDSDNEETEETEETESKTPPVKKAQKRSNPFFKAGKVSNVKIANKIKEIKVSYLSNNTKKKNYTQMY
jgi:hypothetical protein